MHIWLGNIFNDDWYIKLPGTHRLIVGSSNETSIVIYKCNGVDSAQVLIVFLRDLAAVDVELYNLFIRATCQEDILLILVRVERHAVRCLAGRECSYALT